MNWILEKLNMGAVKKCGILLFPLASMESVIAKLEEDRIVILGLDGFKISGDKIQPSLEHSADFSRGAGNSWAEARRFLSNSNHAGYYFEVTTK